MRELEVEFVKVSTKDRRLTRFSDDDVVLDWCSRIETIRINCRALLDASLSTMVLFVIEGPCGEPPRHEPIDSATHVEPNCPQSHFELFSRPKN